MVMLLVLLASKWWNSTLFRCFRWTEGIVNHTIRIQKSPCHCMSLGDKEILMWGDYFACTEICGCMCCFVLFTCF